MNKLKFKIYRVHTWGFGISFSLILGFTLTLQFLNRNFALYRHDKEKVRQYLAGMGGDFS